MSDKDEVIQKLNTAVTLLNEALAAACQLGIEVGLAVHDVREVQDPTMHKRIEVGYLRQVEYL